ncbi:hypothetical protein [Nitrosomonas sp.]|nr:hypothetical protein [Nitrosomonas sp.]
MTVDSNDHASLRNGIRWQCWRIYTWFFLVDGRQDRQILPKK